MAEQLQNPATAVGALKTLLPEDSPINTFLDKYDDVKTGLEAANLAGVYLPDDIAMKLADVGAGLYGTPGTWYGSGPAQSGLSGAWGAGLGTGLISYLSTGDFVESSKNAIFSGLGFAAGGPIGAILGGALGSFIGNDDPPEYLNKLSDIVNTFKGDGVEAGYNIVNDIITGKTWGGDASSLNWDYGLAPLIELGILDASYPIFSSADSKFNFWDYHNLSGSKWSSDLTQNMIMMGWGGTPANGYDIDFGDTSTNYSNRQSPRLEAIQEGRDAFIWNNVIDSSKLKPAAHTMFQQGQFNNPAMQPYLESVARSYQAFNDPELQEWSWERSSTRTNTLAPEQNMVFDILFSGEMRPTEAEWHWRNIKQDPEYKSTLDKALNILASKGYDALVEQFVNSMNVKYDFANETYNKIVGSGYTGDISKLENFISDQNNKYDFAYTIYG